LKIKSERILNELFLNLSNISELPISRESMLERS